MKAKTLLLAVLALTVATPALAQTMSVLPPIGSNSVHGQSYNDNRNYQRPENFLTSPNPQLRVPMGNGPLDGGPRYRNYHGYHGYRGHQGGGSVTIQIR